MADRTLHVRVVSPSQTVFEGEAVAVVAPAWDGEVGILPGHAPMIALLGAGMMAIDLTGGGNERIFLDRGVIKVEDDRVTVLSEYAADAPPEDFDRSRAWIDPDEFLEGAGTPGNPLV